MRTMHQLAFRPDIESKLLLPEDASILCAHEHGELHIRLWYAAFTHESGEFCEPRRFYPIKCAREYEEVPVLREGQQLVWLAHVQLKAMHYHVFVPALLRRGS